MKKIIIWLIILLSCQFALAIITDNIYYVNARQYYELGNYYSAKQNLDMMGAPDNQDPEYALLRGKVDLALGDFKQAYFWLTEYNKKSLGTDPLVQEDLLKMLNDVALYQEQTAISVSLGTLKGKINTGDSEYAPVLTPDGKYMYFSSLRRCEFKKENIFISLQQNNVWSEAVSISELCTDSNESFGSLSLDGNTAYLFGYYTKSNTSGDIYQTTQKNGRWSKPTLIKEVSSNYYDLQPFVWRDKVMFLTSNRDGDHSNYDIYVSENINGTWSTPVNIGNVINTPYDEQSPFLSEDGKNLYFASFGHNSFGGNDIFISTRIGNSWLEWSKPINMGPIINSVKDDRYFVIAPDGKTAYLSSNRSGGIGQEDIYYIDLTILGKIEEKIATLTVPETIPEEVPISFEELKISGVVVDNKNKPVQTDIIWVYHLEDKAYMRIISSESNGTFAFTLPGNAQDIAFEINTPGYKKTTGALEIPSVKNEIFVNITLPIETEEIQGRNLAINGKVLDEENNPVSCKIRFSYIYEDELNEVIVESDAQGTFKLYTPFVNKLKYKIEESGYAVREEMITLPEKANSYDMIIRLVKLGKEITLRGKIVDENDNPLVATVAWIYENEEEIVEYRVVTDENGNYNISLPRMAKLEYGVSKPNYLQVSGEIDIPEDQQEITKNFTLSKLEKEAVFELKNVEFEFNKAVLTPKSIDILKPILATLKENETLEIELSGHTDNIGSRQVNKKISEARAKAVADYFIQNGIDPKRIKTVGYGFDKPIASNDTPEGRQRNRRTEMKILGIEYQYDSFEGSEKEFIEAEKKARIVKTVSKDSAYSTSQTGIPSSLETQFKTMILQNLASKKKLNLKVDLFIDNGKIQSANVRDLMGNLDEKTVEEIADMMLGWKVQSQGRSIYTFSVEK